MFILIQVINTIVEKNAQCFLHLQIELTKNLKTQIN